MSAQMLPFRKPATPPAKRIDHAAVAFQPDAVVIEERPLPAVARSCRAMRWKCPNNSRARPLKSALTRCRKA